MVIAGVSESISGIFNLIGRVFAPLSYSYYMFSEFFLDFRHHRCKFCRHRCIETPYRPIYLGLGCHYESKMVQNEAKLQSKFRNHTIFNIWCHRYPVTMNNWLINLRWKSKKWKIYIETLIGSSYKGLYATFFSFYSFVQYYKGLYVKKSIYVKVSGSLFPLMSHGLSFELLFNVLAILKDVLSLRQKMVKKSSPTGHLRLTLWGFTGPRSWIFLIPK